MSTCLGLYIEDNLIKYAKVSKDNDVVKVDSFGIKFFDRIDEAISQVIKETYSYKIPISINVSNETYNYFQLFSLLNKKDMQSVIDTEFESICYDKGINKEAFETRYVLVGDVEDKEKVKAIHVSVNKADLAKKEQMLEGYRIISASPMGTTIGNLLDLDKKENSIIVNIENKTTITTVVNGNIEDIQVLDEGTEKILDSINEKENSYLKAYEICKNSTIYTSEGRDLQYEENPYLDDIMPTLYNIVGNVRDIVNNSLNRIDKVYITGTASVINNIDIYFQEYLKDTKCEILKPYFINNVQARINIKDYVEVNSAIALGLQGVGEGLRGVNFKKETFKDKIPEIFTMEVGGKSGKVSSNKKINIKMDFGEKLSALEKNLLRLCGGLLLLIVAYASVSVYLSNSIDKKEQEILQATSEVKSQIALINSDTSTINTKTSKYKSMVEKLTNLDEELQQRNKRKNAIPALLNQIMFSVPKGVQITSIENTSGNTVIINAQANTYDQLGYLKASIKNYEILTNVVSDSGVKQTQDGAITTVIEGTLPIE